MSLWPVLLSSQSCPWKLIYLPRCYRTGIKKARFHGNVSSRLAELSGGTALSWKLFIPSISFLNGGCRHKKTQQLCFGVFSSTYCFKIKRRSETGCLGQFHASNNVFLFFIQSNTVDAHQNTTMRCFQFHFTGQWHCPWIALGLVHYVCSCRVCDDLKLANISLSFDSFKWRCHALQWGCNGIINLVVAKLSWCCRQKAKSVFFSILSCSKTEGKEVGTTVTISPVGHISLCTLLAYTDPVVRWPVEAFWCSPVLRNCPFLKKISQ